jgi:hypothetical protein
MKITPEYRMARLYVHHCGFSVVPQWRKAGEVKLSKQLLFSGTPFQQRIPTPEQLRKWFTTPTPRNLAIIPGEISDNLVILDFDAIDVFCLWLSLVPDVCDLPMVQTSRGMHVYIRLKQMIRNGQGFFEDYHFGQIIAHGNITAPPSVHGSGHVYCWHGDPVCVPYLPSLNEIGIERRNIQGTRPSRPLPQPTGSIRIPHKIAHPQAYVQAAIHGECQKILSVRKGRRNNQVYESALKLAKYTGIGAQQTILQALYDAAVMAGLDHQEIHATIRSGLRQGLKRGVVHL